MLVLSRKACEGFVIAGDIRVRVLRIRGKRVQLAIDAPREVPIRREGARREGLVATRVVAPGG